MKTKIYQDLFYSNFFNSSEVIALTTNKISGNYSITIGNKEEALNNRKKLFEIFNLDLNNCIFLEQTHSNNILVADESSIGKGTIDYKNAISNTDGIITDKKNIPLCILTADCLPIFMFDNNTKTIGMIHSGWKGTKDKILLKAISIFKKRFNSKLDNIKIHFGPAIHKCCYEVGEDFFAYFPDNTYKSNNNGQDKYYFDMIKENMDIAISEGVPNNNISDSDICTLCNNDRLFSYRAEKEKAYRMLSTIVLI